MISPLSANLLMVLKGYLSNSISAEEVKLITGLVVLELIQAIPQDEIIENEEENDDEDACKEACHDEYLIEAEGCARVRDACQAQFSHKKAFSRLADCMHDC